MIDLTPILQVLTAIACTVMTAIIIPLARERISAGRLERLQVWARIAVKAAEQLFPGQGRGTAKKAYVLAFLSARGLRPDTAVLNALVECEVNALDCQQTKEADKCHS